MRQVMEKALALALKKRMISGNWRVSTQWVNIFIEHATMNSQLQKTIMKIQRKHIKQLIAKNL